MRCSRLDSFKSMAPAGSVSLLSIPALLSSQQTKIKCLTIEAVAPLSKYTLSGPFSECLLQAGSKLRFLCRPKDGGSTHH